MELCKKLIAELKGVEKQPSGRAVIRGSVFAAGAVGGIVSLPDPFVTDAILAARHRSGGRAKGSRGAGRVGEGARHPAR